jgi:hypothetical protein
MTTYITQEQADYLQNSTFDGAAAAIRAMIKEIPE